MKTLKNLFVALTLLAIAPMTAQTADEILSNYFENTGGEAAWNALEGIKMVGSVNAQGMEIPIDMYQMKDGKQLLKINIQGHLRKPVVEFGLRERPRLLAGLKWGLGGSEDLGARG